MQDAAISSPMVNTLRPDATSPEPVMKPDMAWDNMQIMPTSQAP